MIQKTVFCIMSDAVIWLFFGIVYLSKTSYNGTDKSAIEEA